MDDKTNLPSNQLGGFTQVFDSLQRAADVTAALYRVQTLIEKIMGPEFAQEVVDDIGARIYNIDHLKNSGTSRPGAPTNSDTSGASTNSDFSRPISTN